MSYPKEYARIVKEYSEYEPKSSMDDAVNAARCYARLRALETKYVLEFKNTDTKAAL